MNHTHVTSPNRPLPLMYHGVQFSGRLRDFTSQSGISGIGCSYQLERHGSIVILWGLTIRFLKQLAIGLWFFSPLLLTLTLVIMLLGYLAGKQEGWSRFDSFYWAFVTATTVGYGDFRPTKRRSRIIAILTAVLGLLTMGIIVALGVYAATKALDRT
ncbi:ion channel [Edaphobacter modestus]|uniref:Ion channel n=1 Tax=Edaphobacter modestus TaxID=388466 RepID=A0A4Q7YUF9_9BACT|nr:ion channel [Edaphobacter modestus]